MLFGLAAIPLMVGVGAAVDYGRALLVRERMGNAADAAALAVGSWQGQTKAQLQVKARQYFDANFPPEILGAPAALNLNFSGNDIVVNVSGTVPTTMLRLANFQSIDVHAASTVTVGMGTLEVALALDNSGSMAGSKITALKTAASGLVDSLFDSAKGSTKADPIKIAVVPFAAGVNVGSQYSTASWMDTNAKNPAHGDAQKANGSPAVNNFNLFKSLKGSNGSAITWEGCVEARPSPYDVNDAAPSSGTGSTLFVPLFAPDEPDNWTCSTSNCSNSGSGSKRRVNGAPNGTFTYNNYLPDAGTTTTCGSASSTNSNWTCANGDANCNGSNSGRKEEDGFAGMNITANKNCKYGTSSNKATVASVTVGGLAAGPNFMCTSAPLLPLSTQQTTIKAKITEMQAEGATGVVEGAMWGWRALSPGEPFAQGRAYNAEENQKILILMTDGVNTYYPQSTFLKSWYSIYGYVSQGRLGTTSTSSSTLTAKMDERTLTACNNIKAAGVTIYTVAFEMAGEDAGLGLLQSCASDEDKYFAPNSDSELISAFKAIGKDISELRITK
ncbi:MAG TPA: pilus assembly protein TadG-related protein [Methyloceanibacter sp.]|nr:pilus assembly protein TadG-related protein [Methyloceanibacter sp.]